MTRTPRQTESRTTRVPRQTESRTTSPRQTEGCTTRTPRQTESHTTRAPRPAGGRMVRAVQGAIVAVVLSVAGLAVGCSRTPLAHAVGDCTSVPPGSTSVTTAVIEGRADHSPHRVEVPLNGTVQLQISTDKVLQVHIHGYDIEYDAPGCVTFSADMVGLFDVEAHPDTLLLQLEVR